MWLLSSEDGKNLCQGLEQVAKIVLSASRLVKWNLEFVPIWEPAAARSPSDREAMPKLPEPLSR